jgi:triacylglycerol esterase/lipase EstA (alpha/beta hydrolase family)
MVQRRWAVAIGAVAVAAGLLVASPVTAPATAAPSIGINGVTTLFDPPPPGSNDWHCKPSDEHPNPVVLVHGLFANQAENWGYFAPLLARRGYCVFSLTYGRNPLAPPPLSQVGGLQPMQESAHELARFVAKVRDATGADKVDIVGHSEGSLMPNYYVKFLGGDEYVDHYVGLTPLWDGTRTLGLAELNNIAEQFGLGPGVGVVLAPLCGSCRQFLHGSPFLAKMNSDGGPAVDGVSYTMIMTKYDEAVVPYTSGRMDGEDATNIVLQDYCPSDLSEHAAVGFDPVAGQFVLNALDPDHARPVRCYPVGPKHIPEDD